MTMALENPALLSLAAGFTDNATLPVAEVARVVAGLEQRGGEPDYLQYGPNSGTADLRTALAARLQAQERAVDPRLAADVFITNGSQQALYLAMQVLCDPGDLVLVDRPSYFVFLEMLQGLGIEARSLPTNPGGHLDPEALAELLRELRRQGQLARLKAVYFVSYFSNPTGRSLPREAKDALAATLLAEGAVVPIIEDAAYREMHYNEPAPAPSVLSLPAWEAFPRLYLSTLTKPFATGLKVGYGICTDAGWRARMLYVKGHHDFGTASFPQAVLARVLSDGGFDRHLARIRARYGGKMQALQAALREHGLPELGWSWEEPAGGLYLWLRGPDALPTGVTSPFCRACVEAGVLYVPGELCYADAAPGNRVRLSFGVLGEAELAEAARRFAAVARRFAAAPSARG